MKDEQTLYLGHEPAYWIELERRAQSLDLVRLIDDLARLSAKVYFYERALRDMTAFRDRFLEPKP